MSRPVDVEEAPLFGRPITLHEAAALAPRSLRQPARRPHPDGLTEHLRNWIHRAAMWTAKKTGGK